MKKYILLLTYLTTLCGCQMMIEEYKKQLSVLCTYEGAYSKGVEHAENGERSQASSELSACSSTTSTQALKGYNDGYMSIKNQENNTSTQINVIGSGTQKSSSYICEIEVFTDTYSAKGRSRSEALYNTQKICSSKKGDKFFCEDKSEYKCQKLY